MQTSTWESTMSYNKIEDVSSLKIFCHRQAGSCFGHWVRLLQLFNLPIKNLQSNNYVHLTSGWHKFMSSLWSVVTLVVEWVIMALSWLCWLGYCLMLVLRVEMAECLCPCCLLHLPANFYYIKSILPDLCFRWVLKQVKSHSLILYVIGTFSWFDGKKMIGHSSDDMTLPIWQHSLGHLVTGNGCIKQWSLTHWAHVG